MMNKSVNFLIGIMLVPLLAWGSSYAPDSIYQLDVQLHSQQGQLGNMDLYHGNYTLVSMFYGSCPNVCPMLMSTLQMLEEQLTAEQRDKLRVLLISLDSDNDSPASLAKLAKQRNINADRWTLASANSNDVRKIAAALRIRFRKIPSGGFNHTSEMILLDLQGREVTRSSDLGTPNAHFVSTIEQLLTGQPVNPAR